MKGMQNQSGKSTETGFTENKVKFQHKSFQDAHLKILSNLESSIIGKSIIVEAQRIIKVLDQLIQDIEYCLYLDTDFITRFQISKFQKDEKLQLTEDTIKILQKQADLEQKFKLYANLNTAISQGEEIEESKRVESERLEHLLQENFKNLLRRMQHNPKEFEILKSMKKNLNIELSDYLHGVKCLRILILKQLSITQAEKNIQIQQFQNIQSKIEEQEKTKLYLEQDLFKLKQQNSVNIEEMKQQIEKLKQELQILKIQKQQNADSMKNQIKSQYEKLDKNQQTKIDQLQTELQVLRSRFIKLRDENTQEEIKLKRLKQIQDQGQIDGVQNYDLMMEESTTKLNQLQQDRSKIEQQLRDRKSYFLIVDAQKRQEKDLEEKFNRIKDAHYIEKEKKTEAAKHIQGFFKQYQTLTKKPNKPRQQ
ncbi:unnamed protein product [Paramecium pentaurelia]|uniref:Dynein regulatory complex protein 10 n=1 Tax=Paramecium pentaurelia TaxID=43138 RepID=A0A8S1UJT3_9CILI|nr:unnamed protein product [Paramecium pentaurelia]